MKNVTSTTQKAIPVLHGHGSTTTVVILDRSDADHLVCSQKWLPEDWPVSYQGSVWNRSRLEKACPGQQDFCPLRTGRFGNTGKRKATCRIIYWVVGDHHRRSASPVTQTDYFSGQLWIGCCREDWRGCKGSVHFEQHPVTFFNKGFYAADPLERSTESLYAVRAGYDAHPTLEIRDAEIGKCDQIFLF